MVAVLKDRRLKPEKSLRYYPIYKNFYAFSDDWRIARDIFLSSSDK